MEMGSLQIKASLAETESILQSPKASTLSTLLSIARSDDLVSVRCDRVYLHGSADYEIP